MTWLIVFMAGAPLVIFFATKFYQVFPAFSIFSMGFGTGSIDRVKKDKV
jgi:hypothetical protein